MEGATFGATRLLLGAGRIVILAMAAACAADGEVHASPARAPSTEGPIAQPTGTGLGSPTSAEASVGPEGGSPFARHDTPPGGVAAYLDFLGAGGICPPPEGPAPEVGFNPEGIPSVACAYGFAPGVTVELSLRRTDGAVRRHEAPANVSGNVVWFLEDLPSPIQGEYLLSATQGDVAVERTLLAVLERLDAVVLPDVVRIGTTAQVFVAGGPASGSAGAYLYRTGLGADGLPAYVYATDVGPVELDSLGEGRLQLAARAGDPTGHYLLLVTASPGGRTSAADDRARAEFEVVP